MYNVVGMLALDNIWEMRMRKLTQIPRGSQAVITSLPEGRHAGFRLAELGLRVGLPITVISVQPMRGPVVIRVGQTDIALGHRIADNIGVEPSQPKSGRIG